MSLCWAEVPGSCQWGQRNLSGPIRWRFDHVKGQLCSGWACKGKMAPVLKPHNSASHGSCQQETELSGDGLLGSWGWDQGITCERELPVRFWGSCLLCPRVTPLCLPKILPRPWQGQGTRNWTDGASRAGAGAQRVGLLEAQRVVLRISQDGEHQSNSWESGENGPCPKAHDSVTDIPWVCPDLYTLANVAESSAGHKLCSMVLKGVQSVGLLLSHRLMLSPRKSVSIVWQSDSAQGSW